MCLPSMKMRTRNAVNIIRCNCFLGGNDVQGPDDCVVSGICLRRCTGNYPHDKPGRSPFRLDGCVPLDCKVVRSLSRCYFDLVCQLDETANVACKAHRQACRTNAGECLILTNIVRIQRLSRMEPISSASQYPMAQPSLRGSDAPKYRRGLDFLHIP